MPEIELDLGAQIIASFETLAAKLDRQERREQRLAQAVRQVPLTANSFTAGGTGIIDSSETLRVHDGYYWSVRRLTLSGFTAGTVTAYRNSAIPGVGEPLVPATVAATLTFGRGEMLLSPGDRIVLQCTGITGTVQVNGAADMFEMAFLASYIL